MHDSRQNKVDDNATACYRFNLSSRLEQSGNSTHVHGVQISLSSGCANSYITEGEEPQPGKQASTAEQPRARFGCEKKTYRERTPDLDRVFAWLSHDHCGVHVRQVPPLLSATLLLQRQMWYKLARHHKLIYACVLDLTLSIDMASYGMSPCVRVHVVYSMLGNQNCQTQISKYCRIIA